MSTSAIESYNLGRLGVIGMKGCEEFSRRVNMHLQNFNDGINDEVNSFIIPISSPRFGTGEAKATILHSIRTYDIYIIMDAFNYGVTYKMYGREVPMSPDDHFQDLKRIIAATVGSVTGAYILYGVGRILSRERLMTFFGTRPMRLLGFKPEDISSAVDWFDRKGQATVLICRCIPVVRSLISIPAGTAKMNVLKFSLYTLLGSAVWNTVLCSLGAAAGSAWETVTEQAEWVSDVVKYVIIAIVVVAVIFWVVKRIIPALREGKGEKDASIARPAAPKRPRCQTCTEREPAASVSLPNVAPPAKRVA